MSPGGAASGHRLAGAGLVGLGVAIATWAAPVRAQTTVSGQLRTSASNTVSAVIYLVPEDGIVGPTEDADTVMDQAGIRYLPTVRPVLPGTTVEFRNSDPILHNVFSPAGPGAGFDLGTYPTPEFRTHTFDELGTHIILCHVHPEMYAYVVVLPSPYFAPVDDGGRFTIADVPAGRYSVRVWHRRTLDYERTLAVGDAPTSISIELRGDR